MKQYGCMIILLMLFLCACSIYASTSLDKAVITLCADFESGHFDTLPWQHKTVPWEITQSNVYTGAFSACSGGVFNDEARSVLELTYYCADGYVSFAVCVSSGLAQNGLQFQIDGQPVDAWLGDYAWSEVAYPVDSGMHTLSWIYEIDPSEAASTGSAWIDDVNIPVYDQLNLREALVPENLWEDFNDASSMIEDLIPELDENLEEKLQDEVDKLSDYIERQFNIAELSPEDVNQIYDIIDEVEVHWRTTSGFIHGDYQEEGENELGSDNPLLFTGQYLLMLDWLGVLEGELKERYKSEVREMVDLLRVVPGIFCRHPLDEGQRAFDTFFSHDEQQGLLTLDYIFDYELGYARELNGYGKEHLYCYDNISYSPYDPNVDPFDLSQYSIPVTIPREVVAIFKSAYAPARQPPFIEVIRLAAGEEPVLFNQEWNIWSLRICSLLPKDNTSSKILNYLEIPIVYEAIRDSNMPTIMKVRSLKAIADFFDSMALMYESEEGFAPLHKIHQEFFHPDEHGNVHPVRRLSAFLQVDNPRTPKGKYDLDCTTTCDKDCSCQCDFDCTSRCTYEVWGVIFVDPVCQAQCKLEEITCEAGCVEEEKKCEVMCSLIEDILDL